MISVSTAVANEINKLSRMWSAKLIKVSDSSEIVCDIKKITIHKGACGTFAVGSIFVPYIELEAYGNPIIDEEIKLQLCILVNGTYQPIDIGYFSVTSQKESASKLTVVAQGRLYAMANTPLYDNITETKSLSSIIDDIEEQGYNIIYKNGLTIPSASISTTWKDISCRDALQIVATCVGAFATEDNAGNICLCKYNPCTTSDLTIDGDRSKSEPEIYGEYAVSGCKVKVSDYVIFQEADANLEVTNPYFNAAMWDNYKANLTGLTFDSGSADVTLGDPRLEAWDCVKITDNNDVDYMMPCLTLTWVFSGGLKMDIDAKATLPVAEGATAGGPITKQLELLTENAKYTNEILDQTDMDVNVLYDVTENLRTRVVTYATENTYSPIASKIPLSEDIVMASIFGIGGSTFHANQIAKKTTNTDWIISNGSFGAGNSFTLNANGTLTSRYNEYECRTASGTKNVAFVTLKFTCTGMPTIRVAVGNTTYDEVLGSGTLRTRSFIFSLPDYFEGGQIVITALNGAITIKDLQIFLGRGDDFGVWAGNDPSTELDVTKIRNCFGADDYFEFGNEDYSARVTAVRIINSYSGKPIFDLDMPGAVTGLEHYGEAYGLCYAGCGRGFSMYSYVSFTDKEFRYPAVIGSTPIDLDIPSYFLERIKVGEMALEIDLVQEGGHPISPYITWSNDGGDFEEYYATNASALIVPGTTPYRDIVSAIENGSVVWAKQTPNYRTGIFWHTGHNFEYGTIQFEGYARAQVAGPDEVGPEFVRFHYGNDTWTMDSVDSDLKRCCDATLSESGDTLTLKFLDKVSGSTLWGYTTLDVALGGSGPENYIKSASVSGNTLTLVKQDDTSITFTPTGEPNAYIKDASVNGNTLTLTKKDGSTVPFTPTGGGGSANIFEIVYNFVTGVADKTYAEILAAINANKSPIVCTANMIFLLEEYNNESNTITFSFHTRVTSASKDAYFGYKLTVNSSNVWSIALDEGHFVPNFSNANVGDVLTINPSEIPAWATGGSGGEPAAYIKNASVSGNTLTLTKKDDSTVVFTPSGGGAGVLVAEYGVTTLSQLLNAISAGKVVYELYDDGQIFIPAHVVESEVTFRVANFMEALGTDYFGELSAEYHIVTEDGWTTSSGFYHDSAKQDVLTAGSGISIVNNVISATGGGGSSDVLVVHYDGGTEPGDKSYSEIASALNQRKLVAVICQGMPFFLYGTYPSVMFRYYQAFKEDEEYLMVYTISVDSDNTWSLEEDYFLYCPVPGDDIVPGATLKINENGSPAWINPT